MFMAIFNNCYINKSIFKRALCKNANVQKNLAENHLGDYASKYQVFRDEDSEVILDVIEERQKYNGTLEDNEFERRHIFHGGKTGVYDIQDLVSVLKCENANDIFVASVPPEINYVNHICIASARSHKHMSAVMQFVRKVYKQKRHKGDEIPKLEGKGSKDWLALDLGNIALHIFSREARILYDLDSLWSLGPEFDTEFTRKDPFSEILERHTLFLQDLKPANI